MSESGHHVQHCEVMFFSCGWQTQLHCPFHTKWTNSKERLPKEVLPNVVTVSSVISASEKDQWQQASSLFAAMPTWRLWPNIISKNALISALEKGNLASLMVEHYFNLHFHKACFFLRYVYIPGDSKWTCYPLVGGHLALEGVTSPSQKGHKELPGIHIYIHIYMYIFIGAYIYICFLFA